MTTIIPENIKKTAALTYTTLLSLVEDGDLTQNGFDKVSKTLERVVNGTKSTSEKVQHFLYDTENEVIGRYCNVTHKWYAIDRFMAKSGRVKEMDTLMKKEYARVGKIKKDAEELFLSITQAKPEDKLEMLTKYEELKENSNPSLPTTEEIESVEGGFGTVEELASDLGVDVILEKTEDEA